MENNNDIAINDRAIKENTVHMITWRTYQLQLIEHDDYWDASVMDGRFNPRGSFICGRDAEGKLWIKEEIGKCPTIDELNLIGTI